MQKLLIEKVFECCMVEITLNNFNRVLGCIYQSHVQRGFQSFLKKFEDLCGISNSKYKNVILTGNFNSNILKEDNQYYNLEYKVDFPTRVTLN